MEKMQAVFWINRGSPERAFELRQAPVPQPQDNQICIKTEAFGLNYADIMTYKGYYHDAPERPAILGYDVCGHIVARGKNAVHFPIGARVTALCRFGGYAEYVVTDERAAVAVTEDTDVCSVLSLATQGTTAWYCAEEATAIYPGERVLVTAAAGGVGSFIVQLAKERGARVYGIVSTEERAEWVRSLGAEAALNRKKGDVFKQYKALAGTKSIDVMFDSAGGSYIRKGLGQLAPGGRMIAYGAAQASSSRNFIKLLRFALSFGIIHPASLMLQSQAFQGVNLLRLADHKPDIVQKCMKEIGGRYYSGRLKVGAGKIFHIEQLTDAFHALETGTVTGKIAVVW